MIRQREPRRRDPAYLKWVRRLPCVGCACAGIAKYGVEAAHYKGPIAAHGWREAGISERGDDVRCLGLCPACHRGPKGEHMSGQRRYWDSLGICPACLALSLRSAYEAGDSGLQVIWSAVRARRRDGRAPC